MDAFLFIRKNEIVRRYIVMNSFDGVLTILGIILAMFVAGVDSASLVVISCLGAIIATGISGILGGYQAEKAEKTRDMKILERHLMRKLDETNIEREYKKLSLIMGLANGLSSTFVGLIVLTPFFFAVAGVIGIAETFYASFALMAISLFLLGAFVGKIAKENLVYHGLLMVAAGALVGLLLYGMAVFGIL